MWTIGNRSKYKRDKLRYPSDLTDEERPHVAPLSPPAKHGGRKRKVDVREIANGIAWLNRCRRLAKDFENLTGTALAFLRHASIRLMLRKLCNT